MDDLISREAALEYLDKRRTYELMDGRNKAYGKGIRDAMKDIESQPAVDAVPVAHSRWIEPVPGDGFPYCGNCKAYALDKGLFLNPKLMDWHKTKYCPNCGAKMDLEEQNA